MEEPALEESLYEHHRFVADVGQQPLRVDKFLSNRLENASRNRIQNAVKAGNIRVAGEHVKSNYRVKPGDLVTVVLPHPPRNKELKAEDIPLDIVHEDDSLIVVNKPAGMVVHPAYGNYTGTLVNAIAYHFENLPELKGEHPRPGLVHRIDKDTSGLLVLAKDELTLSHLARQFFDHSTSRKYVALAWGDFAEDEGTVDSYLGRSPKNRKVMASSGEEGFGKRAITHYQVVERFGFATLIQCRLETGRTHQIRVHMQSLGHSLFNDAAYGGDKIRVGVSYPKFKQFIANCFHTCPRQALHAALLGFVHPKTSEQCSFEQPLPEDMAQLLDKFRTYSNC